MTQYYIVDLRPEWKKQPYATLWRPEDKGYAWPVPWAGKYDQETIDNAPEYYCSKGSRRCYIRFPVPCEVVEKLAVSNPKCGRIDNNTGPVLRNDRQTRNALRRAKYVPSKHPGSE